MGKISILPVSMKKPDKGVGQIGDYNEYKKREMS